LLLGVKYWNGAPLIHEISSGVAQDPEDQGTACYLAAAGKMRKNGIRVGECIGGKVMNEVVLIKDLCRIGRIFYDV